jgi:hypothetical protein
MMTRAAIIGNVLSAAELFQLKKAFSKHLRSQAKYAQPFLDIVHELLSEEEQLYAPHRVDVEHHADRLRDLRNTARAFHRALSSLNSDDMGLIRQQNLIREVKENFDDVDLSSEPPSPPNAVFIDLERKIREIKDCADRMLRRRETQCRRPRAGPQRRRSHRKPPDSLIIGIARAYVDVIGKTPAYSRESTFAKLLREITQTRQWPEVGEDRLKKLVAAVDKQPHHR